MDYKKLLIEVWEANLQSTEKFAKSYPQYSPRFREIADQCIVRIDVLKSMSECEVRKLYRSYAALKMLSLISLEE